MATKPLEVKDHKDGAPDHAVRTQTGKAGDPPASSNTLIDFEARGRTGLKSQTPTSSLASGPPRHINVYWAPFSADTKVNGATFNFSEGHGSLRAYVKNV